jgi:KUP system potassium uptake protein
VQTSNIEGQIYVPIINWFLCVGVAALVLVFRSSSKLTDIYGVAVTGTFILNTILFTALAHAMWKISWWRLAPLCTLFLLVEISFFGANLTKIGHGAWLSLAVGVAFASLMLTWRRGRQILTADRVAEEGSLDAFLAELSDHQPPVSRIPGTAVYLSPTIETTPLALRAEVEANHVMHETTMIVTMVPVSISHIGPEDRFAFQWLGHGKFKVGHLTVHIGYRDTADLPHELALARKRGLLARNLDLEHAYYFVSRMQIVRTRSPGMKPWRKAIFVFMARNATSPLEQFALPAERTVIMGSQVNL